tara:strand:- start:413 stop:1804 length:1392 start_codon:yes stop_codon:yes gene_type:complete
MIMMIGIIRYNSKAIATNGKKRFFPFDPIDKQNTLDSEGNKRQIMVASQKKTKIAQWAIVTLLPNSSNSLYKATIVEILGAVHQQEIERIALLRHYTVLPRKYPRETQDDVIKRGLEKDDILKKIQIRDLTYLNTFSIDDESTLDVDDAISIEYLSNSEAIIGIHIAFVGCEFSPTSTLGQHVLKHCASVYTSTKEYPLLHPSLSHDNLSLVQDQDRFVVSLLIHIDIKTNKRLQTEHCFAKIRNKNKTSYTQFNIDETKEKIILQNYTKVKDATDIVASLMIEYNTYFAHLTNCILRTQQTDLPAQYVLVNGEQNYNHASLNLDKYTHATSPIRRVIDIIIQWVLIYGSNIRESIQEYYPNYIDHINEQSTKIKRCHRDSTLLDLVYRAKQDGGFSVDVTILERRADAFKAEIKIYNGTFRTWFPITGSLIAELEEIKEDKFSAQLCGYHKNGFPRLLLKSI